MRESYRVYPGSLSAYPTVSGRCGGLPACLPAGNKPGRVAWFALSLLMSLPAPAHAQEGVAPRGTVLPGLSYTNCRISVVPWSIHVVRFELTNGLYEIQTAHAGGKAIGMDTVSGQLATLRGRSGTAAAAINGDFYQRSGAYSGAPRGLQVSGSELLSAPLGMRNVLWIDAVGQPHLGKVAVMFQVAWPDGSATRFGLNDHRGGDVLELYTPAMGSATRTSGGRELVLEAEGDASWLPLRLGQVYRARVREIRNTGNTRIEPGTMVLSAAPDLANRLPSVTVGSLLRLSTATVPPLAGIQAAISGGPILVSNGRPQRIAGSEQIPFAPRLIEERHPRAAVGWNDRYFFLVAVDGRQPGLSAGMTINELSDYMVRLGCTQALNFDGGGSVTLWYDGAVCNSPCERGERDISNCLVILAKTRRNIP